MLSPPVQGVAQDLAGQAGGQVVRGAVLGLGSQLDQIGGHHLALVEDGAQQVQGLVPEQAARFGGARGGDQAGIQAVDVDGQVDRAFQGRDHVFRRPPAPPGQEVADPPVVVGRKAGLCGGHAADPQADHPDGRVVKTAPHGAGVGVGEALVGLAEIRVGIDLQDRQPGEPGGRRADGTRGQGVLATQDQWEQPPVQQGSDHDLQAFLDLGDRAVGLQGFERGDSRAAAQVDPELLIPGLHLV